MSLRRASPTLRAQRRGPSAGCPGPIGRTDRVCVQAHRPRPIPAVLLLLGVLGALVLTASACGSGVTATDTAGASIADAARVQRRGPQDASTPSGGGKLVVAVDEETTVLDPVHLAFGPAADLVASAVYDPLVAPDENGAPKPYLATKVKAADGYKTWNIHVREGVTFHDGTPFDAGVVKANLEAQKAGVMSLALVLVTKVDVVDATHVDVRLSRPWAAFPEVLLTQVGYMLAPAVLTSADPMHQTPVGTGPFVFDSHQDGRYWRFGKNPRYWQPGLPHLDAIELRPMPDEVDRLSALQTGGVDVILTSGPEQVATLADSPKLKVLEDDGGAVDLVAINSESAPFDDPQARRALAHATDSERWRTEVGRGLSPKATGPLSPGQPGYEEDTGFPRFDLDRAKALVVRYQQDTGQPFAFRYTVADDTTAVRDAQVLVDMWQAAGMAVTLEPLPRAQLASRVSLGSFQLVASRQFGEPGPGVLPLLLTRRCCRPPSSVPPMRFPRWSDLVVDEQADLVLAATDPAARAAGLQAISRRLSEIVPYIWLGRVHWSLAASDRVNGLGAAADGGLGAPGPAAWMAGLWLAV